MKLPGSDDHLSNPLKSAKYVIFQEPQRSTSPHHLVARAWNGPKNVAFSYSTELARQHGDLPLFEGPLRLNLAFYFSIPKKTLTGHRKTHGLLHTTKPELISLVRFIEHAACGVIYREEATIVSVISAKAYDITPRTEIIIMEVR
jgi:Holliday junction resolvase RusA-like endonuclease